MIPHGIPLTFTVKGTAGFLPESVSSVRADVIDGLTPFFDVSNVAFSTDSFLSNPVTYFDSWPYTAAVTVTPRVDYGEIQDVDSVIAHAFYEATGLGFGLLGGSVPTVTADGLEAPQGDNQQRGLSFTAALVLLALVGLVVVWKVQ